MDAFTYLKNPITQSCQRRNVFFSLLLTKAENATFRLA
jgi:hypothetical protein